jgi:hypothetical protein
MNKIAESLQGLKVPLSEIRLLASNPRKGNVAAVVKSYQVFGQLKPIVVRKATGEIIAGNHQYQAAKELGWTEIAVVYADVDEKTARAYAVADNRTGELAEWDVTALISSLADLDSTLFDAAGFSIDELDDLKAILEEQADIDLFPPRKGSPMPDDLMRGEGRANLENAPAGVDYAPTYEERLEKYMDTAVRSIVVSLPLKKFAWAIEGLSELRKANDLETNSDVFLWMLAQTTGKEIPSDD